MTVAFFGNRDAPGTIKPLLRKTIEGLIEKEGADRFLVGCEGRFDSYVRQILRELCDSDKNITYAVVLAYMPGTRRIAEDIRSPETLFLNGAERIPPKFAISRRNEQIINYADCVVCYTANPYGGAGKIKMLAERKGKRIIELAKKNRA